MLAVAVLFSCAVIAAGARRSPHADYVEELLKNNTFGGRISDNIIEDALLSLPDLVRKYNYPLEEHFVTTEDGYILGLHRIPHGRDKNNIPGDRPIVFAMHGLLSSSADYIVMGPGSALAYILAEEGYDVWMGNARGNTFSRRNTRLNPDSLFNTNFWQFSWDEIGNIDLPTMIDYVLQHTGRSKLHYIGYSQGSTAFFVMSSLRPDYQEKIISMQAMGPVAYMAHNSNILMRALAPFSRQLQALASKIGLGEFMPSSELFTWIGLNWCIDGSIIQPLCSNVMFLIGGFNVDQHNATMLPVILGHVPAGAAVKQFAHYGQSIQDKQFRRYDYGLMRNLINYGSLRPPRYDLSTIKIPVYLHYSESDPFAHVEDVHRLYNELGGPKEKIRVAEATFSHLDFVWGIDVVTLVYDSMIDILRVMDGKK